MQEQFNQKMAPSEYSYAGKTWTPCSTVDDNNSFFHAVFGEKVESGESYFDKHAVFRRMYWASFLTFFTNGDKSDELFEIIQKCFARRTTTDEEPLTNLDQYVNKILQSNYWVFMEEIPILCTLLNVRVVLFLDEREPVIFMPDARICRGFPFCNTAKITEQVIRLTNNRFERLGIAHHSEAQKEDEQEPEMCRSQLETQEDNDRIEGVYLQKKEHKKKGSAGFQGGEYQIGLLTMVLLNAVRKMKIWALSTENDEAGKFDDLVFESPEGDVLVQAKHKEGKNKIIKYEALMTTSTNGDFSLPKYYVSFQELKRKFNLRNVVICTNAGLQTDKKMDGLLVSRIANEDSLLRFEDKEVSFKTGGCFYVFNVNGDSKNVKNFLSDFKEKIKLFHKENIPNTEPCIADDDIKEFLGKLQFFVHYLDKASIDTFVDNLIASITLAANLDTRETFDAINKYIQNWFTAIQGVYISHLDAKSIFFNIRTNKYCETLQLYDVSFQNNTLNRLKGRILHVVTGHPILNIVKLYQALQKENAKTLFLSSEDDVTILQEGICVFSIPRYSFLVVTHPIKAKEQTMDKMYGKIKKILDDFKYKKLVLVAGEQDKMVERVITSNLSGYEEVKKEVGFGDLTEDTRDDMKRRRSILFQGYVVSLEELLGQNIADYLDCETLTKLAIKDSTIQIGTKVKHSDADADIDTYYIERKVKRSKENLPEAQLRNLKYLRDRIILISDSAGMGKTTILTKLAIGIKEDYPTLWVTKIDMNSHSNTLKQASKNRSKTVSVDDLLNDQISTKLDGDFIKKLFHKEDKVVLMLDAVDEVSGTYMKLVMNMISDFKTQKNFRNIFITTRPHLCRELEQALQVTAFTLEPFTKTDQEHFLAKYWTEKLAIRDETKKERCLMFSRILINKMSRWINENSTSTFAGIPLQTRMLAEWTATKTTTYGKLARSFLSSDNDEPQLPQRINLIQLYELFIEKKVDIFLIKGNTKGNSISEQAAMDKFEECHEYHRALALLNVFSWDDSQMFSTFRKVRDFPESFVADFVVRAGIVQRVEKNVSFIHRTFAEYFAAQSLVLELKQGSPSEEFRRFLLEEVLLTDEFNVVCMFFDHFLQSELTSIPKDTLSAFGQMDYISIESDHSPSYLYFFKLQNFTGVVDFFLACNDISDCKHLTGAPPYSKYADMVDYLVNGTDADSNKLNHYKESLLLSAGKYGHLKIFKLLIEDLGYVSSYASAFHAACRRNNLDVVKYLVEEVKVDVNIRDDNQFTPLKAAAEDGKLPVIKYLLSHNCDVNPKNREMAADIRKYVKKFGRGREPFT
ncbi:hypothetical protein NQ315_014912 [Exocentrus adspersus]|uniref:NACHT domain-containing protein n=1 Tax=Exocentrus adspersus TaxID=1586481 RepID=A0AAV8V725_9CUCU|nr:hypothetical protein NQ315_014912 [Exocentrus adspersus]